MAFLTAFITRQDHKWPFLQKRPYLCRVLEYDDGPAVIKIPAENQFHVSCCVENDDFGVNKPE